MRIIHACGMIEIARDIVMSPTFADKRAGRCSRGAPILCDSKMVANGITRAPPAGRQRDRLHARRSVRAGSRARTRQHAHAPRPWSCGATGSAGAVVAIGNAPTALFRLLEMLDAGAPPPAAVIGLPVGFVGALESKEALAADGRVPFLIVRGRKGGSAMAVAAVNALASEAE